METIQAIKPGPKPLKEDGTDDKRRRVDPPNQPKYPDLKPHKPKPLPSRRRPPRRGQVPLGIPTRSGCLISSGGGPS